MPICCFLGGGVLDGPTPRICKDYLHFFLDTLVGTCYTNFMIRMITCISAIAAVVVLEAMAIEHGLDGTYLAAAMSAIGGLAGWHLSKHDESSKIPKE